MSLYKKVLQSCPFNLTGLEQWHAAFFSLYYNCGYRLRHHHQGLSRKGAEKLLWLSMPSGDATSRGGVNAMADLIVWHWMSPPLLSAVNQGTLPTFLPSLVDIAHKLSAACSMPLSSAAVIFGSSQILLTTKSKGGNHFNLQPHNVVFSS